MSVMVWLAEGTWRSGVDAAGRFAAAGSEIVLLHVIDPATAGRFADARAGLLGRGRATAGAGAAIAAAMGEAERALFEAAEARLGRPARRMPVSGRTEREVTAAASTAQLLIVVRDGDRTRLGPRSLAPPTRFVVDHAPCPVLLVWPEPAPGLDTIPTPPHHRPR